MRKKLLVIGIMILALSLAGTIAGASKPTIEIAPQEPQKMGLKGFLEGSICINRVVSTYVVETDELAENRTYILEFKPPLWGEETEISYLHEGYAYTVEMLIAWLSVTPKDNERINGKKIVLHVKVWLIARFDNVPDLLKFYEKIFTAIEENEKVSMEVKLDDSYLIHDKRRIKNIWRPSFGVCFRKK